MRSNAAQQYELQYMHTFRQAICQTWHKTYKNRNTTSLEKSLKTVMLTLKIQMSVTLLITDAFANFLAVHDTKHLKFRVQKFESHSVFGIEEYIV